MWGLGKVVPALLAATSSTTTTDMATTFRASYQELGTIGPVYKQASSTVKFTFVTPPQDGKSWSDPEVYEADQDLTGERSSDNFHLFQAVADRHTRPGDEKKPIMLYLPGLDGFGISASNFQFDDLSKTFELWRMTIETYDKSSFGDLVKHVSDFVDEVSAATNRPVYLIGESFSGLLAPAVALRLQNRESRTGKPNPIKGITLVNPATSFDESIWDVAAPLLAFLDATTKNLPFSWPSALPSPYSVIGGMVLSATIPSQEQFDKILELVQSIELGTNPQDVLQTLQGMKELFDVVEEQLPASLLEHRISNWMIVGSDLVNPRLSQLEVPTLVVVGSDDKLIDSGKEVKRLKETLPNVESLVLNQAGHFVLDWNVNLTEAIIYSKQLDPLNLKETKKPYDPILDWQKPSQEEIDEAFNNVVKPLEDSFSPIYMSTNDNGEREMGLGNLPREDGPLLFVSNHQLLGLDLNLVVAELLKNDLVVRGLAHPVVFGGTGRGELNGRTPGINRKAADRGGGLGFTANTGNFERFGAVMVTPRNFYRLMQTGQNALLFPGGVREVFHGRDEAYQLFWQTEKVDFVRTAARFNATIIPLSAVGMADSANYILDGTEVANLPFLGERAKSFSKNVTAARYDYDNEDEVFLPPIVAPSLPSRNYFIFGAPISTRDVDPKDKEACEKTYNQVKADLMKGFDDILRARESDTYKDAPQRLAYERFTGQKAPTFDIAEVNSK